MNNNNNSSMCACSVVSGSQDETIRVWALDPAPGAAPHRHTLRGHQVTRESVTRPSGHAVVGHAAIRSRGSRSRGHQVTRESVTRPPGHAATRSRGSRSRGGHAEGSSHECDGRCGRRCDFFEWGRTDTPRAGARSESRGRAVGRRGSRG